PRSATLQYTGSIDDLSHRFLLTIGHDVHAADAANLANRLDQLDANTASLACLILGSFEPSDGAIGNMHAGHVVSHPLRRLCRPQGTHAREDVDLADQAERRYLLHERAPQRQVVAVLGLDELRAGGDLLGQALRPPSVRLTRRIFRGTQEYARRKSDLAPAL